MPYGDPKSYSFFKMKGHTLPGPFQKNGGGLKPNPSVKPPKEKFLLEKIKEKFNPPKNPKSPPEQKLEQKELIKKFQSKSKQKFNDPWPKRAKRLS